MDVTRHNDHFREMLLSARQDKQIQANTVLFDSWYGSWDNLKRVHRLGGGLLHNTPIQSDGELIRGFTW